MACNVTTLTGLDNRCKEKSMGGVKRIYATEYGNIQPIVDNATHTIRPVLTKGNIYTYEFLRNTASLTSTLTKSETSSDYFTNEVVIQFNKLDSGKRKEVTALTNSRLTMFVEDVNGKIWYLGLNDYVSSSAAQVETGTARTDASKYTLTFSCVSYELPYEVLPSAMEDMFYIQELLQETGITVETYPLNQMSLLVERIPYEDGAYHAQNISAVIWGDGTYTETDGETITGGDTENTVIDDNILTHTYSKTDSYSVKALGTQFSDTFEEGNAPDDSVKSVKIDAGVEHIMALIYGQTRTIESITFDDNAETVLGYWAFVTQAGRIKKVYLPSGVKTLSVFWTLTTGQFYDTIVDEIIYGSNSQILSLPQQYNRMHTQGRYGVTKINLPDRLTRVEANAYSTTSPYENGSVPSLKFPDTVTTIERWAFAYAFANNALIVLPASLTSVGENAFMRGFNYDGTSQRCKYTVVCKATTPPTAAANSFYAVDNIAPSDCTLYVPEDSISAYQAATGWSGFGNILPIEYINAPDSVQVGNATVEVNGDTLTYRGFLTAICDDGEYPTKLSFWEIGTSREHAIGTIPANQIYSLEDGEWCEGFDEITISGDTARIYNIDIADIEHYLGNDELTNFNIVKQNAPESEQIGKAIVDFGDDYIYRGYLSVICSDGVYPTKLSFWQIDNEFEGEYAIGTLPASQIYKDDDGGWDYGYDTVTINGDTAIVNETISDITGWLDQGVYPNSSVKTVKVDAIRVNKPDAQQIGKANIYEKNSDNDTYHKWIYTGDEYTLVDSDNNSTTAYLWKLNDRTVEDALFDSPGLFFTTVRPENITSKNDSVFCFIYSDEGGIELNGRTITHTDYSLGGWMENITLDYYNEMWNGGVPYIEVMLNTAAQIMPI